MKQEFIVKRNDRMDTMKKVLTIFSLAIILFIAACSDNGDNDCPERETNLKEMFPNSGNYYQLFVRSFADSNGDGVGDFIGIKENLDYFEDLGVDGIWLMPIHPSPTKHGYDVLDYYDVNPDYGSLDDFKALLDEANARGIDIIIDYVLNHTAEGHPWFQAFLEGDEDYADYYRRISSDDDRLENSGSWGQNIWHPTGDGDFYAGYFGGYMPDLNWSNPEVQDEMLAVAKYWMDLGVQGFRLDAALHLQASAKVPSHYNAFDETLFELAYFEGRLKEAYPDAYIVGEIWTDFNVYNEFYQSMDSPLHFDFGHHVVESVNRGFNDSYASQLIRWHESAHEVASSYSRHPYEAPFLRNHDQNRIASSGGSGYSNIGDDFEKLRLAAEMLLTAPGNPFIYYGEELGMKGVASGEAPIWDESIRLPMLFENDYKATWPVDEWDYEDPFNNDVAGIESQQEDPDSLFNVYRRLLNLRQDSWALTHGTIEEYEDNDRYLQGYYRLLDIDEDHQDIVLVLHNISRDEMPLFDFDVDGEMIYYSEHEFDNIMAPHSTIIFQLNNDHERMENYED